MVGTLLLIGIVIIAVGIYYGVLVSYLQRPQPGLTPMMTITKGASSFTSFSAKVINSGGIAFKSFTATVNDPAGNSLVMSYSATNLVANGGEVDLIVTGVPTSLSCSASMGPTSEPCSVAGSFSANVGDTVAVVISATEPNGGTYSTTFTVQVIP